ncbi:kinesin-like protein [Nitratireductor aquibiodomus RA22]|uniref:Kinesin-like protein n=2 Tax=Nitratireductor aquibiodomus TaxID=204799 RepID=I5C668_9HYPH|nr:kinesin-like protein [Nitratireductor aquibiodomus RA22]
MRLRLRVAEVWRYARTVAKKNQPKRDFAKELEDALDLELADGLENGDLDIAASMEDLEAQISAAAEELARENRDQNGDGKVTVSEKKDISPSAKETAGNAPGAKTAAPASSVAAPDKAGATASKPVKTEDAPVDRKNLTPVDPAPENNASQPFAPANDDRLVISARSCANSTAAHPTRPIGSSQFSPPCGSAAAFFSVRCFTAPSSGRFARPVPFWRRRTRLHCSSALSFR